MFWNDYYAMAWVWLIKLWFSISEMIFNLSIQHQLNSAQHTTKNGSKWETSAQQ